MEVIEHVDPPRLPALEYAVFGAARPRRGRRDHAERRVQRPLRVPAAGHAPPRPPLRVDPGGVRGLGATASPRRYGYARRASRRRRPTTPRSGRPPSWRCSPGREATEVAHDRRDRRARRCACVVARRRLRARGKSTFARTHFTPTEVVSTDFCRGLVSDDENDQARHAATPSTCCTTSSASGSRPAGSRSSTPPTCSRRRASSWSQLAREHDVLPVAIVLDVPERGLRRAQRRSAPTGTSAAHVIAAAAAASCGGRCGAWSARASARSTCCAASRRSRPPRSSRETPLNDLRELTGPFDIIGDVHGCRVRAGDPARPSSATADRDDAAARSTPPTRRAARPSSSATWSTAARTRPACCAWSWAWSPPGTRCACPATTRTSWSARSRAARSRSPTASPRRSSSSRREPEEFRAAGAGVHATGWSATTSSTAAGSSSRTPACKEAYHGRASGRVRSFALYGDTTGETDEYGLPVRYPWARGLPRPRPWSSTATPRCPSAEWVNNTICLDTGCVFGGAADRAALPRARARRRAGRAGLVRAGQAAGRRGTGGRERRPLDLADVHGHARGVETRHAGTVKIREENAAAALEVMSRFAVDPRWLLYLPPTMAPVATSQRRRLPRAPGGGVRGLRAAGRHRGGVRGEAHGLARGRPGLPRRRGGRERFGSTTARRGRLHPHRPAVLRRPTHRPSCVDRLRAAVAAPALWTSWSTDWLLLDCELLPWSAKADGLLRDQYAAVGAAAARTSLPAALAVAGGRGRPRARRRRPAGAHGAAGRPTPTAFTDAYRRYCWPTDGLDGVTLAPFQILAGRGPQRWPRPRAGTLAAGRPARRGRRRDLITPTRRPVRRPASTDASAPRPASTGGWS